MQWDENIGKSTATMPSGGKRRLSSGGTAAGRMGEVGFEAWGGAGICH